MKDQTYRQTPLGIEAGEYLRLKSKRLTDTSYRMYEGTLAVLAHYYPTTELAELEPPAGTRLLEDFLTGMWGERNPKTYNKNLTVLRDFCKWQVLRGQLHGDPTLPIERAKPRAYHRSTFTAAQREAILEATRDLRYRLALRLLLDYGLRKGALINVRVEHFDQLRRRLVIFTKGGRIHQVPIPDEAFWADLAEISSELGAQPTDFLLCAQRVRSVRPRAQPLLDALSEQVDSAASTAMALEALSSEGGAPLLLAKLAELRQLLDRPGLIGERIVRRDRQEPLGIHGAHDWWYRCLERAGIVGAGVTHGQRMHKARHTAGQRVLDTTGNVVAAQNLLGHASIATTANNYVGWEIDQLHETMRKVLAE